MNTLHPCASLLAAACSAAITLCHSTLAHGATPMEEAHRAYYLGQADRALAIYERLAASGDAEAAERAGIVLLLSVNGQQFAQPTPDSMRAMRLLLQAARAGRPGALSMLNMLDGSD